MPNHRHRKGGSAQQRRRARRAAVRERSPLVAAMLDAEEAAASGSTSLPLSDRDTGWDAAAAAKSLSEAQLPKAFFWRDPDGDPKTKAAYKLGFASAQSGTLTAIWKGVTAAAGAVQGARGGVQIPSGDVAGVKAKIGSYYAKAAEKYGDDAIKPPWQADAAKGESAASLLAYAEVAGVTFLEREGGNATLVLTEAYSDRLSYWTDALAPLDARAALERARAALAVAPLNGDCAECSHLAENHEGDMNDGACTVQGCDCEGMVPMDGDTPGENAAEADVFSSRALAEAADAATEALMDRVPIEAGHAERREQVRGALRLALSNIEFADVALPDEHAPGEVMPPRGPSPAAPEPSPVSVGGQLRWRALLVPEARLTEDFRAFAPDSLTWRELPLTLMGMVETAEGHDGALVSGRIDRIWRDAAGMIWGEGVFDEGDFGTEVGRMVGDGTLRGVSVDVAVLSYEVGPRSDWFDDDGNWAPKQEASEDRSLVDLLIGEQDEPVVMLVTEGVIGAATVCPFQAFADATIELAASLAAAASPALWTHTQQAGWTVVEEPKVGEATGVEHVGVELPADGSEHELTAAAAGLAPVDPPAEWFANPALAELTPLTVTDEGRVYGHAAAWDVCHIGIPDVCTTAPHTQTGNAYFHLGEILCDGGERYAIGKITMGTGHADRGLGWKEAAAHYDDTGTVVADVFTGEDEHGIWVAGALRPDVDAARARELRAATLSGDWRNVNGNLELVALLAVNVPGFPIPRTRALVSSGEEGSYVLALVAAGVHNGPVEDGAFVSPAARAKIEALRDAAAGRFAELAARARDAD